MNFDRSGLDEGLNDFKTRAEIGIRMYTETAALKLESEMKAKAKWTDRSGAARQRLKGTSENISTGHRIRLSQGVEYGMFLELGREKKYAIIVPTIMGEAAREVFAGFKNLIDRIGRML